MTPHADDRWHTVKFRPAEDGGVAVEDVLEKSRPAPRGAADEDEPFAGRAAGRGPADPLVEHPSDLVADGKEIRRRAGPWARRRIRSPAISFDRSAAATSPGIAAHQNLITITEAQPPAVSGWPAIPRRAP